MAFFFTRLVRYIIFAIVLYSVSQYALRWKGYTVSPKAFRSAAAKATGANGLSNVNKLRGDLHRLYSQHILDSGWENVYGGGLNLRATLLFGSLTEFIIVLHAPHRTSGFSGWHWANSTCTVLNGNVVRSLYSVNGGNKEIFKSGSNFRHGEFERYTYEFMEDTFLVCYGRGIVPVSSVWLSSGALSVGDPVSAAKLGFIYSQAVLHEIKMYITEKFHYYKSKAMKMNVHDTKEEGNLNNGL
ncbi:hypothetical protein AB6A40_006874 [Gnathostoma spinigerum]|uniref:Sigma non-opioid intracellular receptor 1 n=1 Tax=Gnathostoma spinigerum TaxID=75299 RepID=A0ABD6EJL4_9BILA